MRSLGRRGNTSHLGQMPSFIIRGMEQGRHIGAGYGTERLQAQRRVVRLPLQRRVALQKFWDHFLTFTDQEQINKIGNRLGVEKGCWSAGNNQGMVRSPFRGPERNMRGRQHIKDMQIVRFKRNRESQDFKIGQGSLGLERGERRTRPSQRGGLVRVREKRSLTAAALMLGKDFIGSLETQI